MARRLPRFVDDLDDLEPIVPVGQDPYGPDDDREDVFDPTARFSIAPATHPSRPGPEGWMTAGMQEQRGPFRVYRRAPTRATYDLETVELPPSFVYSVAYERLVPLNEAARAFLAEEALS
jgi:hypothetical protein